MDLTRAMTIFVRVAQLGGFTRAAQSLRLSAPVVTAQVKQLEAHLGTTLLQRTTRRVRLTTDGAAYLPRAERLLQELAELESSVRGAAQVPSGLLRVDVPAAVGRHVIAPALPAFFRKYPDVVLELGSSDRPVDLLRENVDCVVRGGPALDESLIARRLPPLPIVTCASPDYLRRKGRPRHPDDLTSHQAVHFFSPRRPSEPTFDFSRDGVDLVVPVRAQVSCNDADTFVACALAGLGLIQQPVNTVVRQLLETGRLVRVLPEWDAGQLPLAVLYPADRHLSPRVRAFVEWVVSLYQPRGTRAPKVKA